MVYGQQRIQSQEGIHILRVQNQTALNLSFSNLELRLETEWNQYLDNQSQTGLPELAQILCNAFQVLVVESKKSECSF